MLVERDWSDLLPDLLVKIACNLAITDQISFYAVCAKWRAISIHTTLLPQHRFPWYIPEKQRRRDDKYPQIFSPLGNRLYPLRLYRHHSSSSTYFFKEQRTNHKYPQIFSPLDNRLYPLHLPNHSFDCTIFGSSSDGYLFFRNSDRSTISLFNPFTSCQIGLPPLPSSGYPLLRAKLIKSGDGLRVLIFYAYGRLLCCQQGDSTWTEINLHAVTMDFAYYKGKIFLLRGTTDIIIIQPTDPLYQTILCGTTDIINPTTPMPQRSLSVDFDTSIHETFLVRSSSGEDLFMIGHGLCDKKDTFEVFRLDTSKGHPKSLKVKSIGNNVLFVDNHNAMCFAASDFERCRGNCIYFLHNYDDGAGLFDIGRGTIENLPWNIPEGTLIGSWVIPGL